MWFGTIDPAKEHYEAQVVGPQHVPEATVLALEIGFHSENPKAEDNAVALDRLLGAERRWRKALGPEPVGGPFLGRLPRGAVSPRPGWTRTCPIPIFPSRSARGSTNT